MYSMTIDELSTSIGISKRRIKDLHSSGLIHSPDATTELWPAENVELVSQYAGSRQKKWIHKASMRSALIHACLFGDPSRDTPDHDIIVDAISPADLVSGKTVLRFTKNENSDVTIDELIHESMIKLTSHNPIGGEIFPVPSKSVIKGLLLMAEGYSPCWARGQNGSIRTTVDMMGTLTSLNPAKVGPHVALGALPVFEWTCERIGIQPIPHPESKHPDALLTRKEGEQWVEYAVFKQDDGEPILEPIGVLL